MPTRPINGRPSEPRKVYVETSVWGMTLPNQPRALRQPTQHFLRQYASGIFLPYISTVVLQEVGRAKESERARMMQAIDKLAPVNLDPVEASEALAEHYTYVAASSRPRNALTRSI